MISTTGRSANALFPLSQGERRRFARGFTLFELVLVLLIVSIVAALAAPSFRGFLTGRKSVNAAAQIVALGQYARAQAASSGAVLRLNVDAGAKAYWLSARKDAVFEALGTEFGRRFTLPDGLAVRWMPMLGNTTGGKSATSGGAHDYVDFYPDGRADAATLLLTDSSGKVFQLGCLSETELFKVIQ